MDDERTIRLTSSEEMLLLLIGRITAALTPAAEKTGFSASLSLERGDDNRITSVGVTVPHPSWEVPLVGGIAEAILERQEVVYLSGWEELCEQLFRVPWFRPLGAAAEAPRPAAPPPTTERLSEVGRLAEVNRLLCSWVFVADVVHALDQQFGGEEGRRPDETELIHPNVAEEAPYRMYAQIVSAWCGTFRLPGHLLTGAELMMGRKWKPSMEAWLLGLRPDVRCEVVARDGRYSCLMRAPRPVLTLLDRALLCLGNMVVAGSIDYLRVSRVMPDAGDRVIPHQANPDPTMHTILAAALEELGVTPRPPLELPVKYNLIFNNYGQPYVTIAGPTPVEDLEQLRAIIKEAHDDILAGRDAAR